MRTDDELTLLLRAGFDAATEHLAASPALATQVRRRHRVAQRRRLAVGVAVPAAATAVGTVLAVGGGRAPGPAPIAAPTAPQSGTSAPTTSPRLRPVSYRLALPTAGAPVDCRGKVGAVGKTANPNSVWLWTENGRCQAAAVIATNQLPADAKPITLGQLTGLRGTTDSANGTRTIYAPFAAGESTVHPDGGWIGLTVAADTPERELVRFFVPTN